MSYPENDGHGHVPYSERVEEVARIVKDHRAPDRYEHHYWCPKHGITMLPCWHWWGRRGFGSPKRQKEAMAPRRRKKTHHNERAYPV